MKIRKYLLSSSKKEWKAVLVILIICIISGTAFFIYLDDTKPITFMGFYALNTVKNKELSDDVNDPDLTDSEKLADFDYFCDVYEKSVPLVDYYKELFDIDTAEIKSKWREIISETKSDFEYWGTLNTMIMNIPSSHSYMFPPIYTDYKDHFADYNNMCRIMLSDDLEAATNYWDKIISEKGKLFYENYEILYFSEQNGQYFLNGTLNCDTDIAEIISIDNMPVNKYILTELTYEKPSFDPITGEISKKTLYFHKTRDETAHKHTLVLKTKSGEIKTEDMYNNYCADTAIAFYFDKVQNSSADALREKLSSEMPFYHCYDEANDVLYTSFRCFDGENSSEIRSIYENTDCRNVIIDLRNCTGGYTNTVTELIYPALYTDDTLFECKFYTAKSSYTMKYNERFSFLDMLRGTFEHADISDTDLPDNKKYFYDDYRYIVKGNALRSKNIYILTSRETMSAADFMVQLVKGKERTVVIGSNTGGEGTIGDVYTECMPNSNLVFTYTPSVSFSENSKVNSIYGTAPDIYAERSENAASKAHDLLASGTDPYTYGSRRLWDDILKKALELIKEDENDKGNNTANE